QESDKERMEFIVNYIYSNANFHQMDAYFQLMVTAIDKGVIPARVVCETLLSTPLLRCNNDGYWKNTFQLIREVIRGVDYKCCRDLLKIILAKICQVESIENRTQLHLFHYAVRVLEYILDRDTCILPAYLSVNEVRMISLSMAFMKYLIIFLLTEVITRFINSFEGLATILTESGRPYLRPVVGYVGVLNSMWKLNPGNLKYVIKERIPYDAEYLMPQRELLRYLLLQPYSREIMQNVLSVSKGLQNKCQWPLVEEVFVDVLITAMRESDDSEKSKILWQHLTSQLLHYIFFVHSISLKELVKSLLDKLYEINLRRGRDYLMWTMLHCTCLVIQKQSLDEFIILIQLFEFLYPEKRPLPIPDCSKPTSVQALATACIWIQLSKKVLLNLKIVRVLVWFIFYFYLSDRFIEDCFNKHLTTIDYHIAIVCNAYSINSDTQFVATNVILDACLGNGKTKVALPGLNCVASGATVPISSSLLDSLSVHVKSSFIYKVVNRISKMASTQAPLNLSPAVVETYSRILICNEVELFGIKQFVGQLFLQIVKSNAWNFLHAMLEILSYRLHHIQAHYRFQLLPHIYTLSGMSQTNTQQLQLSIENSALRLISGLSSCDVYPELSRSPNPEQLLSQESEELNKAFVLMLARAMHVTGLESPYGNWLENILRQIMEATPHCWPSHTLQCFPAPFKTFYNTHRHTPDSKATLRTKVDEEYRTWKSMGENETVNYFTQQNTSNVFLCVMWRLLLETNRLSSVCYRILERIGAKRWSSHIRVFADFIVYEFSSAAGSRHASKCIQILNDLIWKYNVVTLDRLILYLALRSHEGNEAQVCFFIIQLLLLKPAEFRTRVNSFVRDNSPCHWKQNDYYEKHMNYHRRWTEKFYFEGLQELSQSLPTSVNHYLPIYFGNVCLRFIPVLDIVIHRFIEMPPVSKSLETVLDHLGCLYKFHDRPITYLYDTLHYYEKHLINYPQIKKKLVGTITGNFHKYTIQFLLLYLSDGFQSYLSHVEEPDREPWKPTKTYYQDLVRRLINDILLNPTLSIDCDWRFNEFANAASHFLYTSCVELLALPVTGQDVGRALFDLAPLNESFEARSSIMSWINAVALILVSLPETYWNVVYEKVLEILKTATPTNSGKRKFHSAFVDNFTYNQTKYNFLHHHRFMSESYPSYVLAMAHAIWHHSSIGQLTLMLRFLKDKVKPIIQTEEQFILVCHLVGPFLPRFHLERTRSLLKVVVDLYEMLLIVDQTSPTMNYVDTICDFFYHIKYMFVGDSLKEEVDKIIPKLSSPLRLRLRFMTTQQVGDKQSLNVEWSH
ncbi:uncharacterized protein TRIADDRAFT_28077, partial [Trichoplax adhaerens]